MKFLSILFLYTVKLLVRRSYTKAKFIENIKIVTKGEEFYVFLKKCFTIILASLFLLTISTLAITPAKAENQDNPYIKAYLNEKNEPKSFIADEDPLVDPVVEDQIIIFLVDYFGDISLNQQTISIEIEDKINIMHKIEDIYASVSDQDTKALLFDYLDRYVIGTDDAKTKTFLEEVEKEQHPDAGIMTLAASSSYNGSAAGDWAYNNYNKYSTNYPRFTGSFGTDCTNFVSQAMHVGGGKAKSGNWTISKKNSKYWVINSASELNDSWSLTDPSPWTSVKEFRKYWKPKSKVHSMSTAYYRGNHKTVYQRNITKGDVIILHKGVAGVVTVPTHLMIISSYDTGNFDFKLAGHSNERQAYPMLNAIGNYVHVEILEIP